MNSAIFTEIKVTENSPLAFETVGDIEKKFGVKVVSVSNRFPSETEQKEPAKNFKLYPCLSVEFKGSYNKIRDLRLHAVDYSKRRCDGLHNR